MLQKSAPFQGWTLAEAIARTANVDAWYAKQRIEEQLAAAGGVITPGELAAAERSALREEPESEARWAAANERRHLTVELDDALDRLLDGLDRDVRAQRLFATAGDVAPLSPSEWSGFFRQRRLVHLRFFPLLCLPDPAERLAGLDLVEAFERAVIWDLEVRAATDRDCTGPVLDAMFTFRRKEWPAAFEEWDIVAEWLAERDDPAVYRDPHDPRKHRVRRYQVGKNLLEAEQVVTDRVLRFIKILRLGVAQDAGRSVPPERWFSPFLWINFMEGHLCEEKDGKLIKCSGPLKLVSPGELSGPSTAPAKKKRPRPEQEKIIRALERTGLIERLGDLSDKAIAGEIAKEIGAKTERQLGALAKAVGRIRKDPHRKASA